MQQPSVSWKFSMSRRKLCVNKHSYRSSFHRLIEVIVEDHPFFAFQKLQHTGGLVVCLYQQRQGGWRRFQHHITTSVRFPSLWLDLDDPERCLNPMGWRSASHSHLHPDVDQWTSNAQSRGKLENHQIFWYFIRYSHAKTTLFFLGAVLPHRIRQLSSAPRVPWTLVSENSSKICQVSSKRVQSWKMLKPSVWSKRLTSCLPWIEIIENSSPDCLSSTWTCASVTSWPSYSEDITPP